MEFLKKLAALVNKKRQRQEAPSERTAQAPAGPGPVERSGPQSAPELATQSGRVWAERAELALPRGEDLSARGTRVQDETRAADPLERLTLLCRRSACDIAAQDDLR